MSSRRVAFPLFILAFIQFAAFGQITSTATGDWNSTTTWVGGIVPSSTDNVIIANGHTVRLTTNQTCNNLTMNGSGILNLNTDGTTLTITNQLFLNGTSQITGNGTTRTVSVGTIFFASSTNNRIGNIVFTVSGLTQVLGTLAFITGNTAAKTFASVTISNTGTWTNTSQNVPITIGGDLIVSGSGTFSQGTGTVTFTGASSNLVSCSNPIAFGGGITVNKGTSQANVIDIQGVITMSSGGLTLTNGTFKLSSASTITAFTADPNFGANARLWCNGGTISCNTNVTFSGQLQVSAGSVTIGTGSNNFLFPNNGTITISGGALNVLGTLSDQPQSTIGPMFFNMTGGTCTVGTGGSSFDDYAFAIGWSTSSTFNMSGGTLVIQNPQNFTGTPANAAANTTGFFNRATTSNFTGGTLQIGNASSPTRTIGIFSAKPAASNPTNSALGAINPIYNLEVVNANVTALLQTPITVSNNLTISSGTLNANNLAISVGGNWTNNGTFTPGTGTVTFNGAAASQTIGGTTSTSFNNLTLNNTFATAPQITLGINTTTSNVLTMTSGVVNLNSNSMSLSSNAAGALVHGLTSASGWMYGGTVSRAFPATGVTIGNVAGLFPIGTSSNFRPFFFGKSNTGGSSGSIALTHTDPGTLATTGLSIIDGASTIIIRNNMFWGSTLTGGTGATFGIQYGGTGLGTVTNLAHLRSMLLNSTIATHVAASGSLTDPRVERSGLTTAQMTNNFYVGSIDSSSPLPIELLSFTAKVLNEMVQLNWSTASELNNDFFTIQRSGTGEKFEDVLQVKGKGTTNSQSNYVATDRDPLPGLSYYRLKQTDFDGKFTYSHVVAVQNDFSGVQFSVFPNPSEGKKFIVELSGAPATALVPIRIVNAIGVNVFEQTFQTNESGSLKVNIDFSNQAQGLYIVIINSRANFQRKLIVD